jgi:two-component system, NarL family, sensor histidine kinase DesK
VIPSSGISIRLWRLYAQAWLVCLLFPILALAETRLAPGRLVVPLAGLALYILLYTWLMWPHPLRAQAVPPSARSVIPLAGLAVLALTLSLAFGSAFLWLFVGLSAVIGKALPARHAFWLTMALTLLTLGLGVWLSGGLAQTDWLHVVPLVLLVRGLGLDLAGLSRLAGALRELHAARDELARQAVTQERLRLARDLHDLLGHSLSMITLKSELAGRLIETQPARAAQEVREVEQAARQALREVREAVAGYRLPTLHGELEAASQLLAAAGIVTIIEAEAEMLAPAADAVLAWAVREGVTNVIRHSRAGQCTIRLSRERSVVFVEVINDGCREPASPMALAGAGSGLAGLAERAASQGGRMEAGPLVVDGVTSFRLRLELPDGSGVLFAAGQPA